MCELAKERSKREDIVGISSMGTTGWVLKGYCKGIMLSERDNYSFKRGSYAIGM